MNRIVRLTLPLLGVVALSATAFAQADVIKARQDKMKLNGQAARLATPMLRGEAPYDPGQARQVFALLEQGLTGFADLFPPGSDKGAETRAAPTIWTDNAGFRAANAKAEADVKAHAGEADKGLEAFRAAFTAVSRDCQSCHEKYRTERK